MGVGVGKGNVGSGRKYRRRRSLVRGGDVRRCWNGRLAWAVLETWAALAKMAVCATACATEWGGISMGEGNVGSVIKSRTAVWGKAWSGVGVGWRKREKKPAA